MSDLAAPAHEAPQDLSEMVLLRYVERHPGEVGEQLASYPLSDTQTLCAQLPAAISATLIARLPDSLSDKVIAAAPLATLSLWLTQSHPDDATTIIGRLSPRRRRMLLKKEAENRLLHERLSSTASTSFARILQVDFLRVTPQDTLEDLKSELRQHNDPAHRSIFVVDLSGRYLGIVDPSKALLAGPATTAETLLRQAQAISVNDTIAKALRSSLWDLYREPPVVDEQQRLIASLRWSDLLTQASARHVPDSTDGLAESPFQKGLEVAIRLITPIIDALAWRAGKP